MNELRKIPLDFIDRFGVLTWSEIYWGIDEGWLTSQSAIDIAVRRLEQGSNDSDEIELAWLSESEAVSVREVVSRLAEAQTDLDPADVKLTWLRLLMAWTFENRTLLGDPFGEIEQLYARFGYPVEIRHLVRYMPSDRAYESKAAAQEAMEHDWAAYIRGISLREQIT